MSHITDSSRVSEAKLLKKYKGLRFFDDEDGGAYYRIRSDRFTWKGKGAGGWVVVCDKMPNDDPAHDPAAMAKYKLKKTSSSTKSMKHFTI